MDTHKQSNHGLIFFSNHRYFLVFSSDHVQKIKIMGTRSLLIHLLPTFNDFVYILKCTCEKNRLVRVYFLIMSPIYTIFRAEFVYLKSETIRISILNTFMILKMSRQFFGLTICVIQIVLATTPKICNIRFTIF